MKFTVELDDFWLEEDDNIESALKDYIIRDVVTQIKQSIDKEVLLTISDIARQEVTEYIKESLALRVHDILKTEKIKPDKYNNKEVVSIEDFVKSKIQDSEGAVKDSIMKEIKKLSISHSEKVKTSYDLAFATQIVSKLNEQGMLKDNVTDVLFGNKKAE